MTINIIVLGVVAQHLWNVVEAKNMLTPVLSWVVC